MTDEEYNKAIDKYHAECSLYQERVKSASDIVEVVKDYSSKIRRRGRRFDSLCLWHNERNPSMEIDPDKGLCHCYSCGKGGDVFSVVMQAENVNFQKAVDILASKYNIFKPLPFDEWLKAYLENTETNSTPPKIESRRTISRETDVEVDVSPTHLSIAQVEQTERVLRDTTLFKWLHHRFGSSIEPICQAYHIGASAYWKTADGLASSFPLINANGCVIDCQLSPFKPDGHGVKGYKGKIKNYAIARINKQRCPNFKDCKFADTCPELMHRDKWCFFGEHLLSARPNAEVAIVEAPKTAIMGAMLFPKFVWLAALNLSYIVHDKFDLTPLIGRKISLFPDKDGMEVWSAKGRDLVRRGFDVGVYDLFSIYECNDRDDLADIIDRVYKGTQKKMAPRKSPDRMEAERVFEEMKQRNPALAEFAEKIDLEPVSVQSLTTEEKD